MAGVEYNFDGKVVIISGASRGLGKALAIGFAQRGARLGLLARGKEGMHALSQSLPHPERHVLMECDLADRDSVAAFTRSVLSRFHAVDVLINNASILGSRIPISDYPADVWEHVLQVNLTGAFHLTQALLPTLVDSGRGSIINISSSVGRRGRADWGAYAVSKFGLEGFTQVLADELKDAGVRVNSVNPGAMATAMRHEAYPEEDQSLLPAPDKSLSVYYYLASDDSINITGRALDAKTFVP